MVAACAGWGLVGESKLPAEVRLSPAPSLGWFSKRTRAPQGLRLPARCPKDSAAGRAFGWYGSGWSRDPGSHWDRASRFQAESGFVPGPNPRLPVKVSSYHGQGQLLPALALQTPKICSRNTGARGGLAARHQKSLLGCCAVHWGPAEGCLLSISGLSGKHRVGLVAWQRACHGDS